MDYEQAGLDFLATEENLPIALEIADLVEKLKPKLHLDFWAALSAELEETLKESPLAAQWKMLGPPTRHMLRDYAKCSLVPAVLVKGQHALQFDIEQGTRSAGYPLYYGIRWNRLPGNDPVADRVGTLIEELGAEGFRQNSWWIALTYLECNLESRDFLLRWAASKDEFVSGLVQRLWSLFEVKHAEIEAANRALGTEA